MNEEIIKQYKEVLTELLFEREIRKVSQEEEAKYMDELDVLWWQLSNGQQDELESWFCNLEVIATADLKLEDVEVQIGESKMPRRQNAEEAKCLKCIEN